MIQHRSWLSTGLALLAFGASTLALAAGCEPTPKSCNSSFKLPSGSDATFCSEKAGSATVDDHEFGDHCTSNDDAASVSGEFCPIADRVGVCEGIPPETTEEGNVYAAVHYYYGDAAVREEARKHCQELNASFKPL